MWCETKAVRALAAVASGIVIAGLLRGSTALLPSRCARELSVATLFGGLAVCCRSPSSRDTAPLNREIDD
jgi:hypothetical protein